MKRYKTVLLTGASSGIGKEFAYALAPQTDFIVLVARRSDKLDALAEDLETRFGAETKTLIADLSIPGEAAKVFEKTIELTGNSPDLLVNNAGVGFCGTSSEIPVEAECKMLTLNNESLMVLCKLSLKSMCTRRCGTILNVASIGAFQPGPYMAAYYASKAFVLSYSEAIAAEARPFGVRVIALCPGTVNTEFHSMAGSKMGFFRRHFQSSAKDVVSFAMRSLLFGYPDLVIPGICNKLIIFLERVLPRRVVTYFSGLYLKD
ncbi:MAG: SDR family oxidoreductase [Fibrobacteraceae bacterium]|nr:SDR family oxidoreductase [Fibrobacteraceae bacterium]